MIANGQSLRVLIADDQEDVLAALRLLLKGVGFHTTLAASPASVIEALGSEPFDLLLMDLNYARDTTSGQEGLDLISRIRSFDDTLPVVVMTAWGSIELAVEAMRRGARDFVLKPWDNSRLISIIESQVENGRVARKKRRLEQARKLIAQSVGEADDISRALHSVAGHLHDELESQSVVIATGAGRDQSPSFFTGAGISEEALGEIRREMSQLPTGARPFQTSGAVTLPIRINEAPVGFVSLDAKATGGEYDADELLFLSEIIDLISAAINNLHAREQDRDIQEAREIQQRLLPETIPQIRGCRVAAAWQPARTVSGDYFDVLRLAEARIALAIADVSGKGLPAAILMSNAQAAIRAFSSDRLTPREMCDKVNRVLCENTASNKFITFFYAMIDSKANKLVYTNAGHNHPVLMRGDGTFLRLDRGGVALGIFPDFQYDEGEALLGAADRLVLFTDGVVEATDDQGEEFGEDKLIEFIAKNRNLGAERLQEEILKTVLDFGGHNLHDDATLIVMSVDSE